MIRSPILFKAALCPAKTPTFPKAFAAGGGQGTRFCIVWEVHQGLLGSLCFCEAVPASLPPLCLHLPAWNADRRLELEQSSRGHEVKRHEAESASGGWGGSEMKDSGTACRAWEACPCLHGAWVRTGTEAHTVCLFDTSSSTQINCQAKQSLSSSSDNTRYNDEA